MTKAQLSCRRHVTTQLLLSIVGHVATLSISGHVTKLSISGHVTIQLSSTLQGRLAVALRKVWIVLDTRIIGVVSCKVARISSGDQILKKKGNLDFFPNLII